MKLTVTQLNRIAGTLRNIAEGKISRLRLATKVATPDYLQIGKDWAKKNPRAFVKLAIDETEKSGRYAYVPALFSEKSPAAEKAQKEHRDMTSAQSKFLEERKKQFADRINAIMDKLYLEGADKPLDVIRDFRDEVEA